MRRGRTRPAIAVRSRKIPALPRKKSVKMSQQISGPLFHHVEEYAKLDLLRQERTSIPEVIYCENKSVEHIIAIAKALYARRRLVLGSRCPIGLFPRLRKAFPKGLFVPDAQSFRVGKPLPPIGDCCVGIASGGTTDIRACEEAALVLESLGVEVERVYDVGVAGIHRALANGQKLNRCDVLIVAAGMEGALPSVIAGLYPQPVIALPTSIGYGTALSGFTALFAMLTSCAPGVTVVNIDNGVGAAAAAFKILSLKTQSSSR
jgi:NCAIR mutase (PurE)-related protein